MHTQRGLGLDLLLLLLSLDAHNHVYDYSGTFGDVRKKKTLRPPPQALNCYTVSSSFLKTKQKQKKLFDWSVGGA